MMMSSGRFASFDADVPTNPADALFRVLNTVVTTFGDSSLDSAWQGALNTEVDTPEFIQYHSEVVGLFDAVQTFIMSDTRLRDLYMEHLPIWHSAIVYREGWSYHGDGLVSRADLKLLGTVGTEMSRAASSTRKWNKKTRDKLDEILKDWEEVCADESLPELVRRDLRTRIDQLHWLIECVGLVGVDRVVEQTAVLVGTGSQAMARGGPSVAKKVGIAIAATVLLLGQADEATQHVAGILEGAESIMQQLGEFATPEPQLLDPPAPTKQLEAGQTLDPSESDDDPV